MSFRLKTIIGVALIEAVLLALLIVVGLQWLQNSNQEQLRERALTTARVFATSAKDAVLATDLASLESLVQEALNNADVVYARVRDSDGLVLAEDGDPEAWRGPSPPAAIHPEPIAGCWTPAPRSSPAAPPSAPSSWDSRSPHFTP